MKLKKLFILTMILSSTAFANNNLEPLLNKVTLTLNSQKWVTTTTALVDVGVNAAITDQGIDQIQTNVLQKLKQLSDKGEWHIVSFNRQLDKSGLESIQISAQARLSQTELGGLRDKAKTISKPGETFTIDNVQFTPSDDELKSANATLRNDLYQQAKTEMNTLNTVFTGQQYYLHSIDFNQFAPQPAPMAQVNSYMARVSTGANAAPLNVGNKVELQATVVLAAMPDALVQKLSH